MHATTPDAEHYFDSAGVRIRYIERGEGEPIVLVHSYTSDLDDQWVRTGVFDRLARSHRVIAFDARGHGRSGKPHDPKAYGPEMAWDIVRLLDHLGLEKAHVVGYSMGAHIVAQLLTLAPRRMKSATLGGGTGRRNWTPEDDRRVEVEAREMEQGLLTTQLSRLRRANETPLTDAEIRAHSARQLAGKDHRALAAIRRSNKAQVVTIDELAAAGVPVLAIVGSEDPYLASVNELKKSLPELTVVVIDGATHFSAPGEPEFVRAILKFIATDREIREH